MIDGINNSIYTCYCITLLMLFNFASVSAQNDFLDLWGPYFGQNEPGNSVEVFADGLISGNPLHGTPVFSPDMNEIYWPQGEPDFSNTNIYVSKLIDNQWTIPEVTSFSGANHDDNPVFSPDGQKLFFNSHRIHNGYSRERIWYVERQLGGRWSDPVPLSNSINEQDLHWQVGIDPNGGLYYSSDRPPSQGDADIFYSQFVNGQFQAPVNMGPLINSGEYESMPFIDPQFNFMLFCRWAEIFVSDRQADGSWGQPQNITASRPDIAGPCPQITPDGNYLFFTDINGATSTVYWTSAQFIYDNYTDVENDSHADLPKEIQLFQNYPNPFNPSTVIRFHLSVGGSAVLKVYDILGNQKALLVNEYKHAGEYEVEFDANELTSGVYFYQLTTGNHVVSKKMIFLK